MIKLKLPANQKNKNINFIRYMVYNISKAASPCLGQFLTVCQYDYNCNIRLLFISNIHLAPSGILSWGAL